MVLYGRLTLGKAGIRKVQVGVHPIVSRHGVLSGAPEHHIHVHDLYAVESGDRVRTNSRQTPRARRRVVGASAAHDLRAVAGDRNLIAGDIEPEIAGSQTDEV